MIVSIHQPNYLPWLGYFLKLARSDVFIFLDDVQFSKNGFINRTKILSQKGTRWLTVPVTYHFGDTIADVAIANEDWQQQHLDTLFACYRAAPCFRETQGKLQGLYETLPRGSLASVNRALIEGVAHLLGLNCMLRCSSEAAVGELTGDARLISLIGTVDGASAYLSGRGGANYQDPARFASAHIDLKYNDFTHPHYPQILEPFTEGLSVLDAAFNVGWDGTAELLNRLASDA